MRDNLIPLTDDKLPNIDISKFLENTPPPQWNIPEIKMPDVVTYEERQKPLLELIKKQTSEIQSLKKDLDTERILKERALSKKDWKMLFLGLIPSFIILAVEHWKDIYDFILSLI